MTTEAAAATRTVEKGATALDVLDVIDRFLASDGVATDEKRALWDVLTALRGPDNGSDDMKNAATIPIRRAALPLTTAAQTGGEYVHTFGPVFTTSMGGVPAYNRAAVSARGEDHFRVHTDSAVRQLRLVIGRRVAGDTYTTD